MVEVKCLIVLRMVANSANSWASLYCRNVLSLYSQECQTGSDFGPDGE